MQIARVLHKPLLVDYFLKSAIDDLDIDIFTGNMGELHDAVKQEQLKGCALVIMDAEVLFREAPYTNKNRAELSALTKVPHIILDKDPIRMPGYYSKWAGNLNFFHVFKPEQCDKPEFAAYLRDFILCSNQFHFYHGSDQIMPRWYFENNRGKASTSFAPRLRRDGRAPN